MSTHTNAPHNATFKAATEKQVAYLESLRASRTPNVDADSVKVWAQQAGRQAVSAKIDELKAMPIVAGPISSKAQVAEQQAKHEPEDGIYIVRGEGAFYSKARIFKVYKMVHGSGRQGVKRLVVDECYCSDLQGVLCGVCRGETKNGRFEYLGLAAKHLPSEAEKMSVEEAKTFGKIYGFCVACGRTLTDETSIANGIGPVCAGKWL